METFEPENLSWKTERSRKNRSLWSIPKAERVVKEMVVVGLEGEEEEVEEGVVEEEEVEEGEVVGVVVVEVEALVLVAGGGNLVEVGEVEVVEGVVKVAKNVKVEFYNGIFQLCFKVFCLNFSIVYFFALFEIISSETSFWFWLKGYWTSITSIYAWFYRGY